MYKPDEVCTQPRTIHRKTTKIGELMGMRVRRKIKPKLFTFSLPQKTRKTSENFSTHSVTHLPPCPPFPLVLLSRLLLVQSEYDCWTLIKLIWVKGIQARTRPTKPTVAFEKPNAPITPRDHMEKKIGNLNRKLRDIDILQARMRASIISKRRKHHWTCFKSLGVVFTSVLHSLLSLQNTSVVQKFPLESLLCFTNSAKSLQHPCQQNKQNVSNLLYYLQSFSIKLKRRSGS